jgi:hypothetical protein
VLGIHTLLKLILKHQQPLLVINKYNYSHSYTYLTIHTFTYGVDSISIFLFPTWTEPPIVNILAEKAPYILTGFYIDEKDVRHIVVEDKLYTVS